jgi:uncharacterized repeat protein (TIGR04138 family)
MLCNQCNEREATVHLAQIMGEKMAKRDLCGVCGKVFLDPAKSIPWNQWNQSAVPPLDCLTARLENMVARDSRYAKAAYVFVKAGLSRAFEKHFGAPTGRPMHLSGAELLEALREQAVEAFGKKAKVTLNGWGVFKCEDFGEIVFNFVEAGLMAKNADDTKADFQNGFDFDMAFPS